MKNSDSPVNKSIVAALQIGSCDEGTAATLNKILSFEKQIKDSKCSLLVIPEASLGGYPKGSDFGTRLGYRKPQGREDYKEYYNQAVDMDGKELKAIANLAKRCKTDIVIGVIERGGSTLYCTAA
ncbi:MAG: carbon-nitrogen hydrolase family protein, partial [Gammaproteobacteria bacterium]|nr:carbon-nitrogen hydrolase family protein [Gammaproteobacteria bacterium]